MTIHQFQPDLPPPANTVGTVGWLRKFIQWIVNSIVTIVLGYLLFWLLWNIFDWAFLKADWIGTTRDACSKEGACWVFIKERWGNLCMASIQRSNYGDPEFSYHSCHIHRFTCL